MYVITCFILRWINDDCYSRVRDFTMLFLSLEREAGSKTEMGLAASRKVTEGYHTRIPGRLCVEYHGEETSNVRSEQS